MHRLHNTELYSYLKALFIDTPAASTVADIGTLLSFTKFALSARQLNEVRLK